jgi:hypothetical protein
MTQIFLDYLNTQLTGLHSNGLYKSERVIVSKQAGDIDHVVEAFAQTGRELGIIPKEIS